MVKWSKSLPEALSPHTLQATKVFAHDDEFDEFESATDDVAALALLLLLLAVDDDVGENGWISVRFKKKIFEMSLVTSRDLRCSGKCWFWDKGFQWTSTAIVI